MAIKAAKNRYQLWAKIKEFEKTKLRELVHFGVFLIRLPQKMLSIFPIPSYPHSELIYLVEFTKPPLLLLLLCDPPPSSPLPVRMSYMEALFDVHRTAAICRDPIPAQMQIGYQLFFHIVEEERLHLCVAVRPFPVPLLPFAVFGPP